MRKIFLPGLLVLALGSLSEAQPLSVSPMEETIVSVPQLHARRDTAYAVNTLSGEKLRERAADTLGETLQEELGIRATTFGPGVGLPVIRGQSGDRVAVLQNGLATLDVSGVSQDHALSLEPLLAQRIEVLRGPAVLLYSGRAIGGTVNVLDNSIPDIVPEKLQGGLELRHGTAADRDAGVFTLDGGAGDFAWHLDGLYRESNNIEIDGYASRETAAAEEAEEHEEEEPNTHGFIRNTASRARSGTLGASLVRDWGFAGFSVNHLVNKYGIPGSVHAHEEEEHEEEEEEEEDHNVRIDLEHTRLSLRGAVMDLFSGTGEERTYDLRFSLGYSDYRHDEIEGGSAATRYENESTELRTELLHQRDESHFGVIGLHLRNSDFSAEGEESFVPRSDIRSWALFLLEDFHWEKWLLEIGGRWERQETEISPQSDQFPEDICLFKDAEHDLVSFSIAGIRHLGDGRLRTSLSRSQRAPTVEELFACGPHIATGTYERGDPTLKRETLLDAEIGIEWSRGPYGGTLNLFRRKFDDYIYEAGQGIWVSEDGEEFADEESCEAEEHGCTPLFLYRQEEASFHGAELELSRTLGRDFRLALLSDYVRGELDEGGDVPRLPPLRYGLRLEYQRSAWSGHVQLMEVEEQDRPGRNEESTEGHTLLSAALRWQSPESWRGLWSVQLRGSNLLDEEVRNATSFIRDSAPEAGRSFELITRLSF